MFNWYELVSDEETAKAKTWSAFYRSLARVQEYLIGKFNGAITKTQLVKVDTEPYNKLVGFRMTLYREGVTLDAFYLVMLAITCGKHVFGASMFKVKVVPIAAALIEGFVKTGACTNNFWVVDLVRP
jgi:hypothetical protein